VTASSPAALLTERLSLLPCCLDDLAPLHEINTDPRSWEHEPAGRHETPEVTRRWIERAATRWVTDGLSYWTVRNGATGQVVGVGGVQRHISGAWNLFYRLAPERRGQGYATELSRAALDAGHAQDPDVPVIGWILAHNLASVRVAARLDLIDAGPHVDPTDGVVRLAYADRPIGDFLTRT
jgi:RimJ/RimL family protein N-acetyltransferase